MGSVILSIGSELLRGDIVDTNAAFLARELSQLDLEVLWVQQVGDDLDRLRDVVRRALADAEVTVCTGGLGPTLDDLTRQAIAEAVGEELVLDPGLVDDIAERFRGLRRTMPESNLRQAMLIPSARALPNPNGTAPGWFVERDGRSIFALPGPPHEMRPMWQNEVFPRLKAARPEHLAMRAIMTFGIGESALEARIEHLLTRNPDVTIATYAKTNGVQVHITARAPTAEAAEALASEAHAQVVDLVGPTVFGTGDVTLWDVVGAQLRHLGLTISTMESCTAGEVANLITNTPGSGDYFPGGIVTYDRTTKEQYGVDPAVMEAHGVISGETAIAMARAARQQMRTDVGVGVTGIAGSEPVEGKPPGTCFVATSMDNGEHVREIHRPGSRETLKHFVAQSALDLVRRQLAGNESES